MQAAPGIYSMGQSQGGNVHAFLLDDRNGLTLVAGDAVCTWPTFMLGWKGFLLNPKQHQVSLRRLAELDAEVLCVGHGEPLTSGGATRLRAALHR